MAAEWDEDPRFMNATPMLGLYSTVLHRVGDKKLSLSQPWNQEMCVFHLHKHFVN